MLPIFLIYEIHPTLASTAVLSAIFKLSRITPSVPSHPAYGITIVSAHPRSQQSILDVPLYFRRVVMDP